MTQANSAKQKISARKNSKKSKSGNSIHTLLDAFIHELSDMRNAEKQLTKALPKMAKAAHDPQLAKAFETHFQETESQIELIDKAIKSIDIKLKREKCNAMEGLIKEGAEIIKEVEEGPVRDTLLIAAAQKVEHYEIASYGCLVAAAKQLGFTEAVKLLDQILAQEKQTDRKLNQLAERGLNQEAFMQAPTQKGTTMPRYNRDNENGRRGRMPERDEEGRFMSDDDRNYGRGQSYSDDRSSSRYDQDYDDSRYSRSSREDDYDDNDRSYSSRDRDEEDYDDNRSRSDNRGHGGWFGDSEGHSRAARQGRGNGGNQSRSRMSSRDDRYDDNNSRSSSSSRGRSSGQGRGWFGDPEGHARAGRHSHDNDHSSGRR